LPNIEWPLSVDPLVWPSVFFSKIFREETKLPYGYIEVDPEIDGGEQYHNMMILLQAEDGNNFITVIP
jgi:hypothetical protein